MALCKVCGTSDSSLFYDSIKTYCKEHWKYKVRQNRIANIEHYRAFDVMRASMPHKISTTTKLTKKRRTAIKGRTAAHSAISRGIRSGVITRMPGQMCGTELNVHAHHDDYAKPLEVMWLCVVHHKSRHAFLDFIGVEFERVAA